MTRLDMHLRSGRIEDVPGIAALEQLPGYEAFIGQWTEEQHGCALDDSDTAYLVAIDAAGTLLGFAILRGLASEHRSLELKRIAVGVPNQGVGQMLLEAVAAKAFEEHAAHRLWLDVFQTNIRAIRVYERFGFRVEGCLREAKFRDGAYHSQLLMSLLDREYRERYR